MDAAFPDLAGFALALALGLSLFFAAPQAVAAGLGHRPARVLAARNAM